MLLKKKDALKSFCDHRVAFLLPIKSKWHLIAIANVHLRYCEYK